MRRPRLPFRRSKQDPAATAETQLAGEAPEQARAEEGKAEGAAAGGPAAADAKPPEGPPPPPADPHERIDGLRAWLADAERKFAIRTYAIAAATVLALAAGIVAVVLVLGLRDEAATTDDVQTLRNQLGIVREEAETAVEEQVADLADQLQSLQQRVARIDDNQVSNERELQVLADDIDDLREQLFDLEDEVAQAGDGPGGPGDDDDDLGFP